MLEDTIAWRRQFEILKIHTEFKDTIMLENATGKMYVRGFDKEGAPLIYMKPVNENTKDHAGNIKHLVYTMERAVACMDANGAGNTKLSLVIDYNGYTSAHSPPMKTSLETLSILQNHYPERLKCAYCIRAPFIFYAFFKMVSPFIDPVTKKKIVMVKNAEIGTAACQLSQDVDPAVLETCVGGEDSRPFVSATYLGGPFELDYRSILDRAEAAKAEGAAAVSAADSTADDTAATGAGTGTSDSAADAAAVSSTDEQPPVEEKVAAAETVATADSPEAAAPAVTAETDASEGAPVDAVADALAEADLEPKV